jgi:hypothetical protein
MICPRCEHAGIETLALSPVPGVWQVLQCGRCHYTWRTSEPARRSSREAYPAQFRLTQADLDAAQEMPTVPPLRGDR